MSCHPGHRPNYPAQATLRGSQGDDRLEAYPKRKSSELIMVSFQPSEPVPVACQMQGWPAAWELGWSRLSLRTQPPTQIATFAHPDSPIQLLGWQCGEGVSRLILGAPFSLLGSKSGQKPTHFVNHQKDRRERKPALASGQGF